MQEAFDGAQPSAEKKHGNSGIGTFDVPDSDMITWTSNVTRPGKMVWFKVGKIKNTVPGHVIFCIA